MVEPQTVMPEEPPATEAGGRGVGGSNGTYRPPSADDQDLQRARAVHALDPVELDVRGRRRTGDKGDGPALALDRSLQADEGLGDEAHYLPLAHDAQMVVGQERERPAALRPAGIEHDGARLGYAERAARQHAVALVELLVRKPGTGRVVHGLYALWDPISREVRGDDEASHAASPQGFFYGPEELVAAHAMDVCFVLRRALCKARDDLLASRVIFLAVFARD